ncbi:MAG: hypothetical protein QOG88_1512 [Actinomycetota bacterium]|nr:hypothetical protein [Actinomycetota bacterium]
MRYAKLVLGVLLAVAGLFLTVGTVMGSVWYVQTCRNGGVLVRQFCSGSGIQELLRYGASAVALDLGALMSLRFRDRPWRRERVSVI